MTKAGKRKFMRDLCRTVLAGALARVDKMPPEWDGIELRHYIADRFGQQALTFSRGADLAAQRRYREYKNTVLVNNL